MGHIKRTLLGLLVGVLWALGLANAEDVAQNSLDAMNVVQQGALLNVKLTFKEPLRALPAAFSVAKPARIALDFPNTTNGLGKSSQTYNEGDLKSANIVQAEDRTRVVLNLGKAMTYESTIDGNNLLLVLAPSEKLGGAATRVEHFSQARSSAVSSTIRDIAFRRGKDGEARITVDLTDANAGIDIKQQGSKLVVDFAKVSVPEHLRKHLDVTDFATPVLAVDTLQQGANTRMTITPRGLWEHNAYQSDNQFVIEVKPIIENPNKLVQGSRGGYQGEKLSLNFQNVDVRRLLQVIGEFTGMNMVVSDSVGGAITLILKDVPWDQALDIIMQQKGLDMRKHGNVIMIAPRDELAFKEAEYLKSRQTIDQLEPLVTEAFQINYIKAEDIRNLLRGSAETVATAGGIVTSQDKPGPGQSMLSSRGSVRIEPRSNVVFVQDTAYYLDQVRAMIARVDTPARQVMIEARIVEAEDTFSRALGVRLSWGQTYPTGAVNIGGNSTAISGQLIAGTTGTGTTPPIGSFPTQVNLPVPGATGTLSFLLFNKALTQFLGTEISAREADGKLKVISNPRVMTANQVEAIIEQGTKIPYQTSAGQSGATAIQFQDAVLSLKVTPQITPDGRIMMKLDINKNAIGTTTAAGPTIETKHVKTEALVENGGTVVIGGIYTQEIHKDTQRIPFLGDLPYVGFLFRNRSSSEDKKELLIFITPKIVAETMSMR